ncbi:MAG: hypothetical protein A3F43_06940 [Gammaproteobacteria bacterium RIFCSPHIGHO2_12_FULL_42_10]|nr:MAG: hypothetical protein A3F43_06940 [Gammaproteobacteria bacterium RIFCSPHIGHO2_12_FULL_42_10]
MEQKKQVLVVTNEMSDEEVIQIRNAFEKEATKWSCMQLTLVHVIPRLPTCYFSIPTMGILVEKYYDEAKNTLTQVGKHLQVSRQDQWLISGGIRTEVLRLATKLGSSFILASARQIQELQRSLFFKNIHQYAVIKNINQIRKP